jgi:nitroimidazol reductase NimA-like FMN-containing flavoprotein (pyridoxamine 5'-phosphate oxidase superfamily)
VAAREKACSASYYYRSLVVKGKAALVSDPNRKLKILEKLMEKYQPEGGYGGIPQEILKKTAVIEISIQEITGKERLG